MQVLYDALGCCAVWIIIYTDPSQTVGGAMHKVVNDYILLKAYNIISYTFQLFL